MKLENQVCSLELAKKLKELGVKQDGIWKWYESDGGREAILSNGGKLPNEYLYHFKESCSAFTVAELGEMLPERVVREEIGFSLLSDKGSDFWCIEYWDNKKEYKGWQTTGETEADARAKMLIYLLENSLLPTPSIEKK